MNISPLYVNSKYDPTAAYFVHMVKRPSLEDSLLVNGIVWYTIGFILKAKDHRKPNYRS